MSTLTNIKDVDLKILSELDDKSLFRACRSNKYLFRICNAEPSFWRNRYTAKYGEMAAKYKPEDRSWKNHYMQTVIDLDRFRDSPANFLDYIAWGGSIEDSYFLYNGEVIPLLKAPEWVMTNFWLLDLGELKIDLEEGDGFVLGYKTYSHLKPHELLAKFPKPNKGFFILGFIKTLDRYILNSDVPYRKLKNFLRY
jgi:hypothetical protein